MITAAGSRRGRGRRRRGGRSGLGLLLVVIIIDIVWARRSSRSLVFVVTMSHTRDLRRKGQKRRKEREGGAERYQSINECITSVIDDALMSRSIDKSGNYGNTL